MNKLINQIRWWETSKGNEVRGSFNRELFRKVCNAKNTRNDRLKRL